MSRRGVCTLCYCKYDMKHPYRVPRKLHCEHTFCTGKYLIIRMGLRPPGSSSQKEQSTNKQRTMALIVGLTLFQR